MFTMIKNVFAFPDDVRNDLYVTIMQSELKRTGRATDRNIEVTLCVCNQNGDVLQVCFMVQAICGLSMTLVPFYQIENLRHGRYSDIRSAMSSPSKVREKKERVRFASMFSAARNMWS